MENSLAKQKNRVWKEMEHQEDTFQAALDKRQVTHELSAASENTLLSLDSIFKNLKCSR